MNWKLLTIPAAVLASSVLLTTACEPCEGDECSIDDGIGGDEPTDTGGSASDGSAGQESGGSESGGRSSAGGTGSAGASTGGMGGHTGGMAAALDCQEDGTASGTPGSCEPSSEEGDPSYECERCVQELCCTEFAECNASGPTTSCRFGSTLLEGDAVEGEFDCMLSCLRTLDGAVGDQYDVDVCAGRCGAAECDADSAGAAAINLTSCMLGFYSQDALGCQQDCQMLPE